MQLSMAMKVFLCAVTVLVIAVSFSEANYHFSILFYEFRNPLGLQCDECGTSGGLPACCDDVQRRENCSMTRPFTCDTRFRFLLRPFGSSVDTVPNTRFPYFTRASGGNSETFNERPNGLFGLPNPFTFNSTMAWPGRIQFFIDAVDRPVNMSETLAIINRFPIDLELDPGTNFTDRTTYTGIYNISGVVFDMSFRVQCADNFFGPNCTTFCEPVEGVYTCDMEGRVVCLHENQVLATNCTTCSLYYDNQSQCTQCVTGRDTTTNCTTCLPGYDTSLNCTQCLSGYDPSTNCEQCIPGYNPLTNCRECLPDAPCQTTQEPASGGLAAAGGAIGAAVVMVIVLIIALIVVIIVFKRKKEAKFTLSGREASEADLSTASPKQPPADERATHFKEHNFDNPIYGAGNLEPTLGKCDTLKGEITIPASGTKSVNNGTNKYREDGDVDVPNPCYREYRDTSQQPGGPPNVHYLDSMYASVDKASPSEVKPSGADGEIEPQLNAEYDVIERHETSTQAPPSTAGVAPVYSEVGAEAPREGEVYNVAYPVHTHKEETTQVVDGYACLSSVH